MERNGNFSTSIFFSKLGFVSIANTVLCSLFSSRLALAGPCDPQLPIQDVTRNIKSAFRRREKLAEPGKAKIAMSQKQRQKLAKEIEQVTREYQDRHLRILTTTSNSDTTSTVTVIPIPTVILSSNPGYTATDCDLDDFLSFPPSSDPLPDLPKKRGQEENQNPPQTKRQRLSIDKRLTLLAVNHEDESLTISTQAGMRRSVEKRRSSRRTTWK